MPRRHSKPDEEHSHIAIQVATYEAQANAAINHTAIAPQYAWDLNDDDPLYSFTSHLRIVGDALYPENRTGYRYELTIYGNDAPSRRVDAKLKDVHARDKHGSPQYRSYRGREIPVYNPPKGMGILDKVRGEQRWTAWVHATPRFVSDALALLSLRKELFLTIHERKIERTHWIQGITLQTADPREE